jgi:hypothetical protein
MALVAAILLFTTQSYAETALNSSKSTSFKQTGGNSADKAATRKDGEVRGGLGDAGRLGGGGGGKGATGPANAVKLNSSRSN